ncbi:MAG: NAD(P)H-dependent oxidoreductase [Oscillospiraceae bacterium]|nr:NAD(P)H-dependent oxidoreductase [Oscillospiraceae bacterium]
MSILFINGSPEENGNTAALAKTLLAGRDYETLNLSEVKVYPYGSRFADDQFDEVLQKMKAAHTIVIGSPVYWHNICGSVRNLLDRFYGPVEEGELSGRKLVFLFQGAAPEKWMLDAGEYTMSRFAMLYGMKYLGMATNARQAKALSAKL